MSALRFHELTVKRVSPEAAGSVAITFAIPADTREAFNFQPGQFLTLRAKVNGEDVRRNYSISSPRSRLAKAGELEIGIRPVEGGVFSNWAAQSLKAGDRLAVMPPDGRFTIMMPHPERVFRTVQMSWHPESLGEDSPWMRMFRNARKWVA